MCQHSSAIFIVRTKEGTNVVGVTFLLGTPCGMSRWGCSNNITGYLLLYPPAILPPPPSYVQPEVTSSRRRRTGTLHLQVSYNVVDRTKLRASSYVEPSSNQGSLEAARYKRGAQEDCCVREGAEAISVEPECVRRKSKEES